MSLINYPVRMRCTQPNKQTNKIDVISKRRRQIFRLNLRFFWIAITRNPSQRHCICWLDAHPLSSPYPTSTIMFRLSKSPTGNILPDHHHHRLPDRIDWNSLHSSLSLCTLWHTNKLIDHPWIYIFPVISSDRRPSIRSLISFVVVISNYIKYYSLCPP